MLEGGRTALTSQGGDRHGHVCALIMYLVILGSLIFVGVRAAPT